MKPTIDLRRPSWRTATFATALGMLLGACGPESMDPAQDDLTNTDEATHAAFDAWRQQHVVPTEDGQFRVEGDMRMPDLEAVRAYWTRLNDNPNGLSVYRDNGVDAAWNRTDRWNISYCIRPADFGADYARLVEFMHRAASGWEGAANVRFVHVVTQDGVNCNRNNNTVKYNVERNLAFTGLQAGMGFPTFTRPTRFLELGPTNTWTDAQLLAVLTHEFGHAMGFLHEHDTAAGCGMVTTGTYRPLTCYDGRGAMHYPSKPGWLDPARTLNFISQRDVEGAQSLYEAPTNALSTANGVVYARKRSTGDIYRRDAAGWTVVGGPGQAFVAVGNTLYGQIPGGGAPVQYLGTGWVTIGGGGAVAQILPCAGTLCSTNAATGNISRYNTATGTWTLIGGPGSRFAATTTQVFGLGSWQDDYVALWSGVGTGWSTLGGTGSELVGGGNSMYRLDNTKNAIQRYDGGITWTTIGGSGRGFVAVGNDVYGLRPDGSLIMKFGGASWTSIHGAATKIFSSNGYLLATDLNDNVERYDPATNTWTNLGKP
ncbi:M57 family metalloprotease [Myxococcus sp. K15C18031901]|uniref:M57 family metalloprotease n=1 Tax=Myxococcus dinghuensis TaxID=2906761 RepID=UPI0020A807A6|nr:M57 family metalloprotease [Myxococcus dinghuensis]MCP3105224.1 M57 family metalloprotease [Myxococcus dinghuensis]